MLINLGQGRGERRGPTRSDRARFSRFLPAVKPFYRLGRPFYCTATVDTSLPPRCLCKAAPRRGNIAAMLMKREIIAIYMEDDERSFIMASRKSYRQPLTNGYPVHEVLIFNCTWLNLSTSLVSDAVTDLTPRICSRVRLKR
ncbi:hypothetical protein J6590_007710 [Homalodisca vitripennis]|nr:hypothetical protein J6590_007710 [Homalodisca vitripennis]